MDLLTGVAGGDVRFTPHSRPISGLVLKSGSDPKRTFVGLWGSEGVCTDPLDEHEPHLQLALETGRAILQAA